MSRVVFCSQVLFSSATVAFRTNFLSLADFKSDLSWTNLKLPSSATWPDYSKSGTGFVIMPVLFHIVVLCFGKWS